ncbi:MAG: DUF1194 domain-containing protein [Alphaproteobacteria bacterium]|nr:DUF1194 domain-containing protein [Alphaproteobacteria bacterium]
MKLSNRAFSSVAGISLAVFMSQAMGQTVKLETVNLPPGNIGYDACIVEGLDTSISMEDRRLRKLQDMIASSLESDEFGNALKLGRHKRVLYSLSYFDDTVKPITGWAVIDEQNRFELAQAIRQSARQGSGYTLTQNFVIDAIGKLDTCRAERRKINIVTDGTNNARGRCAQAYNCPPMFPVMGAARDAATLKGYTINIFGIQLGGQNADLAKWAKEFAITPDYHEQATRKIENKQNPAEPGRFFKVDVSDLDAIQGEGYNIARMMHRQKLVIEMSGIGTPSYQVVTKVNFGRVDFAALPR